ncbi:MAG: VWA domain-containing protein, partial [Verrucomicrobiota bacterium]
MEFLLLLLLLPLGGILYLFAERRRLRDRRRMAGGANASPAAQSRLRHFVRLLIAAGFLILALSRPAWREVPMDSTQEGRDIVFLLDVSRSMLAEDLAPNRLEAAKTAIRDCVDTLEGDRVGLVVFAGSASILCPLTNDYHFFYDKLNEAHPDFVSPGDTRVGGTRIGDALHKICDKLLSIERLGYQDVVLLSDGGDQDSRPDRAAERLNNLQVRFLLVGLGDSIQGARIPARADDETQQGPFVRYEGDVVWSKLEDDGLKALAEACTHGVFLRAGTRVLP